MECIVRILKWLLEIDEGEGRLGEVGFELSFLDMMLTVMTGPEDGVFNSF